jgi:hypothetical protein
MFKLHPNQPVTFLPAPDRPKRHGYFVEEGAAGRYWISATPGGSSGWWIGPEQITDVGEVPTKGKRR